MTGEDISHLSLSERLPPHRPPTIEEIANEGIPLNSKIIPGGIYAESEGKRNVTMPFPYKTPPELSLHPENKYDPLIDGSDSLYLTDTYVSLGDGVKKTGVEPIITGRIGCRKSGELIVSDYEGGVHTITFGNFGKKLAEDLTNLEMQSFKVLHGTGFPLEGYHKKRLDIFRNNPISSTLVDVFEKGMNTKTYLDIVSKKGFSITSVSV